MKKQTNAVACVEPELAVYPLDEGDGLSVKVDAETVWLTQKQMAMLFDVDRSVIIKHLVNIYAIGELDQNSTSANFALVQIEGGRSISREVKHFNLDAVISVGFRVNSRRGVLFRQWANKVIKEKMLAKLAPAGRYRRIPSAAERNRPLRRSRSAATCSRCLFGRLVESAEMIGKNSVMVECHASRPTSASGFPLVRPDDFCPCHVSVKSRKRTFAGLVPEAANYAVPSCNPLL